MSLFDRCPIQPADKLGEDLRAVISELCETKNPGLEPAELPLERLLYKPSLELPSNSPRLLVPTGYPRSGKDLIADYLQATYKGVGRLAFSDVIILEVNKWLANEPLLAHHFIHTGNKSHAPYRKALQIFGIQRRIEKESYWVDSLRETVLQMQKSGEYQMVVMTGARALSDVDLVCELHGHIWRVIREGNPYEADSPIERAMDSIALADYEAVIYNDREGDILHFLVQVEAALWGANKRILMVLDRLL